MKRINLLTSIFSTGTLVKVTNESNVVAAISVFQLPVSILNPSLISNPDNSFPEGKIYFKTKDGNLHIISRDPVGDRNWFLLPEYNKHLPKYYLTKALMYYAYIAMGESFRFQNSNTAPVTAIVLVTDIVLDRGEQEGLQEALLVKEFNSKK